MDIIHNQKFKWVIIGGAMMLSLIIFWSLDKGLIMLDEAFYLLHFQEGAYPIAYSNWFILAKPLYIKNLYVLRILVFSWLVMSSFFLGFAFSKYWRFKWPAWFTGILAVFAQFILSIPVQYVPNNVTFNILLIYSSLGFLFLSPLYRDRKFTPFLLLILSGFCIGFLPFTMITNTPLMGVLLVAVYVFFKDNQPLMKSIAWAIGVFISIFSYFFWLQPWEEFVFKFQEAVTYTKYMGSHGIRPLIQWHLDTLQYFMGMPLALSLILYYWGKGSFKTENLTNSIIKVLGLSLLLILLVMDITSRIGIFPTTLFYVFSTSALFILLGKKQQWEGRYFGLALLALVPYFATLGTDVAYQIRSVGYFSALLLMLIALLDLIKIEKYEWLLVGLFGIVFLNFLTYPFREGWARYSIVNQTEKFDLPNGQGTIKLNAATKEKVNSISPYLNGKKNVVISHPNLWGLLYLSGGQALALNFMPNEDYIQYFSNEKGIDLKTLIFVEGELIQFSEKFKTKVLDSANFQKIDQDGISIYLPLQNL